MGTVTKVKCPTCGKAVPWTEAQRYRPFCSERCRLIDLGEWFEERHRIPDEGTPAPGGPEDTNGEDL